MHKDCVVAWMLKCTRIVLLNGCCVVVLCCCVVGC